MDAFGFAWTVFAIVVLGLMIFEARRRNQVMTRLRRSLTIQDEAISMQRQSFARLEETVAQQDEILALMRRLIELTEEANRQRAQTPNR